MGRLAEGEELSSNPLRRDFNDLRTTQVAVDVAWRILGLFWRAPTAATAGGRFAACEPASKLRQGKTTLRG